MKRVIRLLDPPKALTPRQRAQQKYRASPKGKASQSRYFAKRALDPTWRPSEVERVSIWARANAMHRRVYKRIWSQTDRRLKAAQGAPR